jgi:hypothetical protein
MKKLLVLVVAALAATGAASADAQKGGPATLSVLDGGHGVVSPDGKVRYVTLSTGRQTIVSFVRVAGGQVLRWRYVPGYAGVPLVGVDGTTDGVSRDGRTLVLAGVPEARADGEVTTRFSLVDTRSLKLRRITLPGTWSYDAISPDGSFLYLIQYTGLGASPAYKVRAYDAATRRLLARPIVDSDIGERLMRGWALTRKTSSDGRWAYTLYAREKHEPFVHALDTVRRQAYCIDLPLDMRKKEQMTLRLALRADRMLHVRHGGADVAAIDTRTFVVHKH